MVEPNWIAINRLQLTLPHLAAEFEQYRIVQISDIHVDKWTNEERLNRIFRLLWQSWVITIAGQTRNWHY
ncbi:hypothetical protein [Chroococcidiopsis sp. TS-821]|uniref:hypothetical protein n=1 Tax=Chroococcidiopsis sp. TS-821 TaxID=1378066 RepID=UPI000CEE2A37|nr:hypothetical protein [Chroococcidiopsis sp. TS-821]PPS42231.1 hypothetical protein B1A85_14405 [Chroococcidiopsis sp. TS-821]